MPARDMFAWVDAADAAIGDGTDIATRTYWTLWRAFEAGDTEGVRAAREQFAALARAHNLPWLEVFGRHWDLQWRLTGVGEGASAVRDAVELFELAHRPANLDCPQTICAAQDLCIAYSRTDGPGYADAVIAAATDTLNRIDAGWPCYDCVSAELRDGLMNAGRHDEALALIDQTVVAIRGEGQRPTIGFARTRLAALVAAGRESDAYDDLADLDPDRFAEHAPWERESFDLQAARVRLHGGDVDDAVDRFERSRSPIEHPSIAPEWLGLARDLLRAGALENGDQPSATIVELAHLLLERGAYRHAFDAARLACEAAAARGARRSAVRARTLAERIARELVDPASVADQLSHLEAAIAASPDRIDPAATRDVLIDTWETSWEEGALGADDMAELVATLSDQGWVDAPRQVLWRRLRSAPGDERSAMMLFELCFRADDRAAQDEVVTHVQSVDPSLAHWFRARQAAAVDDWPAVSEECAAVVALDPGVCNTRRLWSEAERRSGNHDAAAVLTREVLALAGTAVTRSDWWDAILHGTLVEDWALVRRACAALDIPLAEPDGVIEEQWERCQITFVDDDGNERTHTARRTGPATAQIVNVAHPDVPQHFDDVVVFEPVPMDPVPADADEQASTLRRYPAVMTRRPGGCRSVVVEAAFDDDQWIRFRDSLYERGFPVWAYAGEYRTLDDGREVEVLPAAIALRPDSSAEELADVLDELTDGWEPAPAWVAFATELDRDADLHATRSDALWN